MKKEIIVVIVITFIIIIPIYIKLFLKYEKYVKLNNTNQEVIFISAE